MKLLLVGDIHLGRRPARIPEGLDARRLGPVAAWEATVERACREGVDAVLLAGDVVDREDDLYEAYGPLRDGVRALVGAGIRVLAVAGNHDVLVLPRLAREIPELTLLGEGGRWEVARLESRDGARVRVLGWSFPEPVVRESPLRALPPREDDTLTLGLLHCDRDQSGSPHAPVTSRDLAEAPVDAWALGHIHRPDPLSPEVPRGYLGSLTGLDPGEPGPRGPWLLETDGTRIRALRHLPLAPLRWEAIHLDAGVLGAAGDLTTDLATSLTRAIEELEARLAEEEAEASAIGLRLTVGGVTPRRAPIETAAERLRSDPPLALGGRSWFIETARIETSPPLPLEELAQGTDPVALLARRILALRDPASEAGRALVERARGRLPERLPPDLREAPGAEGEGKDGPVPEEAALRARLEASALRLLDRLLAQSAEGDGRERGEGAPS